jgi:uncharacterized protein YajQ (UPF0234 family)
MPSFDIVSKIDMHEVTNAVDQANREVNTRFDFKNTNAKFELAEDKITLSAQNTFQLQQMLTILETKLAKRQIDIRCLNKKDPQESLHEAKQLINIRQGIDQELAKRITQLIKNSKLKVQAAIQGEQIRVTGKKRDDLQEVIAMSREQKLEVPLQYENFRD